MTAQSQLSSRLHRFLPSGFPALEDTGWSTRDLLVVLACALVLRLIFAAFIANTFDPDEFVILSLSRSLSHGAIPYRDFVFFHPPGVLAIFAVLQPLINWWWPVARAFTALIDTCTALIVWRIGVMLYGRRAGVAAGLLYAASPLALVCGVRVGPDPLITALGMGGLLLLLTSRSHRISLLAGICIGLAIWTKYPAVLFIPVYLLAAPRRTVTILVGCLVSLAVLFAPLLPELHQVYQQTVVWQLTQRQPTEVVARIAAIAAYLLLLHPLTVWGLAKQHRPPWLLAGLAVGGAFILTSQVYYHYLLPIVPFAVILAAPRAVWLVQRFGRRVIAAGAVLILLWAQVIAFGTSPLSLYVSSYSFADIQRTVQLIHSATSPGAHLITDHFEYAYLTGRATSDYFWNMRNVVGAHQLEQRLAGASAVILTRHVSPTYPPGFVDYLESHHYHLVQTQATDIWLLRPHTVIH